MEFETSLGLIFGFLAGMIVAFLIMVLIIGPQITEIASYMSCDELKNYILSFPSKFIGGNVAPVLQLKCGI